MDRDAFQRVAVVVLGAALILPAPSGVCLASGATVCSGGPFAGSPCTNDSDCSQCTQSVLSCATDTDCGRFCSFGGGTCLDDSDCRTGVCDLGFVTCRSDQVCLNAGQSFCVLQNRCLQDMCNAVACVPTGACCQINGTCIEANQIDCSAQGGSYRGDASECSASDSDGDGVSDTCDICMGDDATGDSDGDSFCDDADNCPATANPDQSDCDGDEVGDACAGEPDCNANGIPDECDVAAGTSEDCNTNGVPDDCEPNEDCNSNGVQDICDVALGTSQDCNANNVPDECDVALGTSQDCNGNAVPDECENALVGYWSFDEGSGPTAGDSSGNGLNGTLVGSVSWATGISGSALRFDSTSDYVNVAHNSVLNFQSDLGVAFWINGPAQQSGADGLFSVIDKAHRSTEAPPNFSGWTVQGANNSGGQAFFVVGNGSSFPGVGIPGILDSTWHHVTVTATTNPTLTLQSYVDGLLSNTYVDPATSFLNNSDPLRFGARSVSTLREYEGLLDEVRIYDGPLTQCQIMGLANPAGVTDCNGNGMPDECDPDCNGNGIADECDISGGTSTDCSGNLNADECDLNSIARFEDFEGGGAMMYSTNSSAPSSGPNTVVVDDGSIRLTEAAEFQMGAVIFDPVSPFPVGSFTASFDFKIGPLSHYIGASGFSFAVFHADAFPLFGEDGPGCCGTASLAVSFDTFDDGPTEPGANFVELFFNGNPLMTADPTFIMENAQWNHADITFDGSGLTLVLTPNGGSAETVFDAVPIVGFSPFVSRYGFGASTGGLYNEHRIDNVLFRDTSNGNDCDTNGVPDECEPDCNGNGVPDECEPNEDCNSNGVQDICDITAGTSQDCNANAIPDECDVALGTSQDCNGNAVLDECDIARGEGCAGPMAVAFFFDATYVDVLSEAPLLRDALVSRGHTVTSFSGTSGSSWSAVLAAAEVLVIPELDGPDLSAALDPAARTAIQDFVNAGGGYVQAYCDGFEDLDLLNDLFGTNFATCDGFGTPHIQDPLAAAGTCFEGGPAFLPYSNDTNSMRVSELPADALAVFSNGTQTTLATWPYGSGQITWLGFDFYETPTPTEWVDVADRAVQRVADGSLDCNSNGIPDECDPDADTDAIPDDCDICPGFDDTLDTDADGVPDCVDICPGFDDTIDADGDGIPNGCDETPFDPGFNPQIGEWKKTYLHHVRLMTWNILRGIGPGKPTTPASPTTIGSQYDYIGRVCRMLDPDIIAFQEVRDGPTSTVLAELQSWADQFFGTGTFVVYVGTSAGGGGFIRNAILSRYPFVDLNGAGATNSNIFLTGPGPGGIPLGGDALNRGWTQAGIDLPDAHYPGDLFVGCNHLKAGGSESDFARRLRAAQNIAYYVNFALNTTSDPYGIIANPPAVPLSPQTPVVMMGDMNDRNYSSGGPVEWLSEWHPDIADDGTDRDGTLSRPDQALDPFLLTSGTSTGFRGNKIDYIIVQDSVATTVEEFVFDSWPASAFGALPPDLANLLDPYDISFNASDHLPVIVDLQIGPLDTDYDDDGLDDPADNCPTIANGGQEDADSDGSGDACDGCPTDTTKIDPGACGCNVPDLDGDGDGVADCIDLCPGANDFLDADGDAIPDACDTCTDPDGDGVGNTGLDTSGCSTPGEDNCPVDANPDQADCDGNGIGDACDIQGDSDRDGACNDADNCLFIANPGQEDLDGDNIGNACDPDADADGFQGTAAGGNGQDCDDLNATINPLAQESAAAGNCLDGADNDCDGAADTSDPDCTGCLLPCGDMDGTGQVNLFDFASFAGCFGSVPSLSPDCECADLNRNDEVNLADFATFGLLFGKPATTNSPPYCQ